MKKRKLLCLVFFISIFSCVLPIETIEPKINGFWTWEKFEDISNYSVDEDENIYIIDKNIIKRIDSKTNEIKVIAGNKKEDKYKEGENIDGNIDSSKFGSLWQPKFVKKENTLYFYSIFNIKRQISQFNNKQESVEFCRKIVNNKIETLKEKITFFENMPEKFIIENQKLFLLNEKNEKIFKLDILDEYRINDVVDLDNKVYLSLDYEHSDTSLYIVKDKKALKIFEINDRNVSFSLDAKRNLYIFESTLRENLDRKKISNFYSPVKVYKITKDKLLNLEENYDFYKLKNDFDIQKKLIGYLPEKFSSGSVSYDGKTIYTINDKTIYKIKI